MEGAETDERGRNASDDGTRLETTVAEDASAREREGETPRGGHPEGTHRLRGDKLAEGRAEHGAAVAVAGVGGRTGALELEVDAGGTRVDLRGRDLAEGHGAAVPELPRPLAELVATVVLRVGAPRAG